jgi:hypothetical protein
LQGMVDLVGVFFRYRRSKMFPTGLLGFVVWGSEKLFVGVLTKIKIIFLQITHNGEHIKNSTKKF